jgi:hypothetical protein
MSFQLRLLVPKKRRITPDQARLLAIKLIMDAVDNQLDNAKDGLVADSLKEIILTWYDDMLPTKWDAETSDKSWNQLWEEMRFQLVVILKGLDREAVRIRLENPDFTYKVQYPLSNNGIAQGSSKPA